MEIALALIVVAALLCATALYVVKAVLPLLQREVETRANAPRTLVPIPSDLILAANKWHDEWAREQMLQNIQELYDATQDWDRVRFLVSQQDMFHQDDS